MTKLCGQMCTPQLKVDAHFKPLDVGCVSTSATGVPNAAHA